jgi:hypothetical protein
MKKFSTFLVAAAAAICAPYALAHHGSNISYDTTNLWSTWATVTEFNYANPHPTMKFERTTKDGQVEQWVSELLTNPSVLIRSGWTRQKSVDALKPGTRVKLHVGTARVGGFSAIVMKIENEKGESIVGDRANMPPSVDLDGVPGGLQRKQDRIPGRPE